MYTLKLISKSGNKIRSESIFKRKKEYYFNRRIGKNNYVQKSRSYMLDSCFKGMRKYSDFTVFTSQGIRATPDRILYKSENKFNNLSEFIGGFFAVLFYLTYFHLKIIDDKNYFKPP